MIPMNDRLSSLIQSPIRAYTAMAKQIPDCALLTIGEPDLDTPECIKEAAAAALENNQTHYAPNQGTLALRQAVADYETCRGKPTTPEQVLITVGATQALFTAIFGVLNPGDEILIPAPGFGLYESIATVAGTSIRRLDIAKTGFQLTKEALAAAITDRTRLIILNSPCNPTGTVFTRESLDNLKQAVLGKPIFVLCDNVYDRLVYGDCPDLSLDQQLQEQLLLCQSFSKPYAMTGWRIGYLVCPEYVMERLRLLSAALITAVPTFVQEAAITALATNPEPMRQIYARRREYVCRRLDRMGLTYPQPQGAFYVFPDISRFGLGADEFCTRMMHEAKVAAVPGTCFGTEGHIRLSYCYSDEELEKGLNRLEQFISGL